MTDEFKGFNPGLDAPGVSHYAVVPNDGADLPIRPRAIFVGGAGNLAMRDQNGEDVTWQNVAAGSLLPFRPLRVLATGTTATALVAVS